MRTQSTCAKCNQLVRNNQAYCPFHHSLYMKQWRKDRGGRSGYLSDEARLRSNARAYLHVYLKRGKLKKGLCKKCGSPHVEAHHTDYRAPLEVTWLCHKHHLELGTKIAVHNYSGQDGQDEIAQENRENHSDQCWAEGEMSELWG
jgi:hypothetical protein